MASSNIVIKYSKLLRAQAGAEICGTLKMALLHCSLNALTSWCANTSVVHLTLDGVNGKWRWRRNLCQIDGKNSKLRRRSSEFSDGNAVIYDRYLRCHFWMTPYVHNTGQYVFVACIGWRWDVRHIKSIDTLRPQWFNMCMIWYVLCACTGWRWDVRHSKEHCGSGSGCRGRLRLWVQRQGCHHASRADRDAQVMVV